MKNTTQRILSNGTHPQGDIAFVKFVHSNNPICGKHWDAAITNNPGGHVPELNPDGRIEELKRLFDETIPFVI